MINGGGSNSLVSAKDLVTAGIANLSATGNLSAAVQPTVTYGPPPAPTNVAAGAAIQNVIVTWAVPDYPGHAYAEVWGASTDNIGTAVALGQAPGAVYVDPIGPSVTRYYWVRFVNVQDTAGPYNAVNGTVATTGAAVDYLLNVLNGQISTSQLATSLNTRLNGIESNATAITTEASSRTTADNSLYAQYTVKVDVNGYVAGFGLANTLKNATPFSQFIFKADQFAFGAPGQTSVYPFVIQTTPTTVNGVTVPAGTYIDGAYIKNGTITNAKIGDAAIDNAKIASLSADKLTAGTVSADRLTSTVINAKVTNIDAAVIQTGFIDAARINTASIANAKITNANIDVGTISVAKIDKATITNLSSLNADLGTITAGTAKFSLDTNNYIIIDGPNQRIEVWSAGTRRVVLGKL